MIFERACVAAEKQRAYIIFCLERQGESFQRNTDLQYRYVTLVTI